MKTPIILCTAIMFLSSCVDYDYMESSYAIATSATDTIQNGSTISVQYFAPGISSHFENISYTETNDTIRFNVVIHHYQEKGMLSGAAPSYDSTMILLSLPSPGVKYLSFLDSNGVNPRFQKICIQ